MHMQRIACQGLRCLLYRLLIWTLNALCCNKYKNMHWFIFLCVCNSTFHGFHREEREEFIKAKYVHHKFVIQTCSDVEEQQQDLQTAIQTRDIQAILQVYAEGLDLMTVLPEAVIISLCTVSLFKEYLL